MKLVLLLCEKTYKAAGTWKTRVGKLDSWVHLVEPQNFKEGERPMHDQLSPHLGV